MGQRRCGRSAASPTSALPASDPSRRRPCPPSSSNLLATQGNRLNQAGGFGNASFSDISELSLRGGWKKKAQRKTSFEIDQQPKSNRLLMLGVIHHFDFYRIPSLQPWNAVPRAGTPEVRILAGEYAPVPPEYAELLEQIIAPCLVVRLLSEHTVTMR